MKKITTLLLLLLWTFGAASHAQSVTTAEEMRVARLAGLAKVWGEVKFFHPYLASRDIDWDKALVRAIPRVNQAKNAPEYAAAVNEMLAAIGDESTRAEVKSAKKDAPHPLPTAKPKEFLRLEGDVLWFDMTAACELLAAGKNTEFQKTFQTLTPLLARTKGLIVDARGAADISDQVKQEAFYFVPAYFPALIEGKVTLGTWRYRLHNGYAPQVGATSGGYYTALVTDAPEFLNGESKTKLPPAVLLVNKDAPISTLPLSGLQASKKFVVVAEGAGTNVLGASTATISLPDDVTVTLRNAELVAPDGALGFAPDVVAAKGAAESLARRLAGGEKVTRPTRPAAFAPLPVPLAEKTYAEMTFPATEYRLLALFRWWNVIAYFYPYKDLIGTDWNTVLPAYIAKFEANKDAGDYQSTVREMVAEIHDSHGFINNTAAFATKAGGYFAPVFTEYLENQSVIVGVLDAASPARKGDVIVSVNGEPIETYRVRFARFNAASTPQSAMSQLHKTLLRGQKDAKLSLSVRGTDGKTRDIALSCTVAANDPRRAGLFAPYGARRKTPIFQILPGGAGYVDLARLQYEDVDKMFETIQSAPAVIFDMRGYPNGTAWAIAPRLTSAKNPVGALFSNPIWAGKDLNDSDVSGGAQFTFAQPLPSARGALYKGKMVMLINEASISQSEHTALFFETAVPGIAFIGTPTAGANGDVTNTVFPGNLVAYFSGHSVRHADGRQLQRVGIQPTITASPTIAGVLAGRDEVLEAALRFLGTL